MKNTTFTLFVGMLIATLTFSSCNSFLEEEVLDQISVDYIYSNGEGLEVGVNALYNLMRSYNIPSFEGDPLRANAFFMAGTDLGQTRTWHRPYGATNHNPTGFTGYKWVEGYQIIDRCNAIIIGARNVDDIDQAEKNKIVAEARVIRAELYFDLIRMYDNILLDTTATTPQNVDDPVTYAVANPDDVYALINGDLEFAIEYLAYDEPYGRYSKSVARHLRGKSAMWQSDWTEAITQFDAIINESGKSLVDINVIFGQNLNHSEMLFAYTRDELLGGGDNLAGGGGTWIGSVFTSRWYEMGSGDFTQTVETGGQALGWSHPNDYLQSLYDRVNDKRYTAFYYPDVLVANNPSSPRFGEPIPVEDYDDNIRRYHFSLKKFFDEEKSPLTNDSWKDYPMYRLAETYLLAAEAYANSGNQAKAVEYINRIRERAFGSADYNFTEYTLDSYLEESARELAMERNRWFLLKRLGLLVERQNLHYRYGSNSTNLVPEPMAPHMVRCPIPQGQIDLMGTFPQNPGY